MLTTNTEQRHPVRTCVGCRRRARQHELVRCVLGADRRARVDRAGAGRGAWVCGPDCASTAMSRKGFERAWRTQVPASAFDGVLAELTELLDVTNVAATSAAVQTSSARHERLKTRAKG